VGQAVALPLSMTAFAFVGVIVTSATAIVLGQLFGSRCFSWRFQSPILVTLAMIAVAVSTLATNIAANIVSPANDFSNLAPQKINFRMVDILPESLTTYFSMEIISDPRGIFSHGLLLTQVYLGRLVEFLLLTIILFGQKN